MIPLFSFHEKVLINDLNKFDIEDNTIKRKENIIGFIESKDSNTSLSIQYHTPDRPKKK